MKPEHILQKTKWASFEKAIKQKPEEVIEIVKNSGLTGRGGGNFLTGLKWEFTLKEQSEEKYFVCNADEGEPGAFKDKFIIENNPEILIEGIAIASYAVGAKQAYIYVRGEYDDIIKKLQKVINKSKVKLKKINLQISIIHGAGAYICGEATAMVDSIEGLRGEPRIKPPHPSNKGLWGKPTGLNNVETLANVPLLFEEGWNKNLRLFSVSGNVENSGVYEFPLGITVKEVLDIAKPKNRVKAIYFGCSGGCIPADKTITLDFETIKQKVAMLGPCTIIIVDEKQNIPNVSQNMAEFFVRESCGKCAPCREGTFRILEVLERINKGKGKKQDINLLEELADFTTESSLCGLGQSCATHIKTELKYFKDEFEKKCK